MKKQIGIVNKKVIQLLDLKYTKELPIIIGESNLAHMQKEHPKDFEKYGNNIEDIINNPTYVALNPNQNSIEYIKEYKIDDEFVLVAVRVTNNGTMFARTLFVMTERKKEKYLSKGYARKYWKITRYVIKYV